VRGNFLKEKTHRKLPKKSKDLSGGKKQATALPRRDEV